MQAVGTQSPLNEVFYISIVVKEIITVCFILLVYCLKDNS